MSDYPFKPINTGQQWPEGIVLFYAKCEQCGRKGKTASVRIEALGMVDHKHVCAECLADFVAGAPVLKARVFARAEGSVWQELHGEVQKGGEAES